MRHSRTISLRSRGKPGTAPGTLIADPNALSANVRLIAYDGKTLREEESPGMDDVRKALAEGLVVWVDVTGLGDVDLIERVGGLFGLHRLALEDVVNTHQRPKTEEFADHLFVVTRMPSSDRGAESEQVSMFVGARFVLTFQERPGDCFEPVRERLRRGKGRIRGAGPDYLAYALIDAVTDTYFPLLEHYGERIETLENDVTLRPTPELVGDIHDVKRDLLAMRRAVWPQREMTNALLRTDSELIQDATRIYLRDCYDHVIQLMDILEIYREIASGLVDIYLSAMSTRLNEIMKVLTTIATIFIPLSFIAGIYGMNFDPEASPWNMPELNWRYGYFFALGVMLLTALALLVYLWRKHWIATPRLRRRRPQNGQGG